jgi:hypothetical protein
MKRILLSMMILALSLAGRGQVASWLIPGGVSSSAASVAGAVATGTVIGAAGGAVSAGTMATTGTARMVTK